MKCSSCGFENTCNAYYCVQCGKALNRFENSENSKIVSLAKDKVRRILSTTMVAIIYGTIMTAASPILFLIVWKLLSDEFGTGDGESISFLFWNAILIVFIALCIILTLMIVKIRRQFAIFQDRLELSNNFNYVFDFIDSIKIKPLKKKLIIIAISVLLISSPPIGIALFIPQIVAYYYIFEFLKLRKYSQ